MSKSVNVLQVNDNLPKIKELRFYLHIYKVCFNALFNFLVLNMRPKNRHDLGCINISHGEVC